MILVDGEMVTEDYHLRCGDRSRSSYHTWLPEFEVLHGTDKAVRIAIPNKFFGLRGDTSFDTVDIWLPKRTLVLSYYNIKKKKATGWAWNKVFVPNVEKTLKEIKARKKKAKLKRAV